MPETYDIQRYEKKEELLTYLRQMCEIRFFEETVYDLLGKNMIKGASHLYAGQEAVAVGAISNLQIQDLITSTHRGHGHCHAIGDLWARDENERQEHLNKMMAELCGRATGYCRGRGGSMHIADVERGNLGATGIVGGNIPVAVGAALAKQMQGDSGVVLCFFGDGAVNTGNFHEALNLASIWSLPVVFICENNLYGMSVPFKKACRVPDIAQRGRAYAIKFGIVDGMKVLQVKEEVGRAIELCRIGDGPYLVEAKTYRWYGHSRSDPMKYRTRDEEKQWQERDPIMTFPNLLIHSGIVTQQEIDDVKTRAQEAIKTATEFALTSPFPPAKKLGEDVYVEIEEFSEPREKLKNAGMLTYWQAIRDALDQEMARDERVFIIGEDVGLYGGAYGATRGLFDKYGEDRVKDTPISEATIAGACIGAAMTGMRPVGEIMFIDFTTLVMDQLANQGAKNRYMFGGKTTVPMVMRTEGGAGRCIAAHHSQSLEAIWMHFPGIYVVMPSTPYDAKGLLKTCIRDDNPILFIEHKMLYGTIGPVPKEDYCIPLGVADVKKEGSDITLFAYSRMLHRALEAADIAARDGIEVEVIDPRTLKPLDLETLINSVKKTGRFIGVTEAYGMNSFITEVITLVIEHCFDYLDAPPIRIGAADVPVPMSETLEDACIPNVQNILDGIFKVLE